MTDTPQFRDPGEVPVLDWVDKGLIDVDPAYQRPLDENRVQRILDWFDWKSFGALILAPVDGGRFHVTDGQHRLEAAKRHPRVAVVPGVIIAAAGTQEEAANFIAINRDRKNISALDRYWAELTSGDPEAQTVDQVCQRAGVKLLRYPGSGGKNNAGETVAIAAIRSVIDKHGALRARQILEVPAKAGVAPITGIQIAAAAVLLTDPEYRDEVDAEGLAEALGGRSLVLEDEANAFAVTHRLPKIKAFASVWFKRTRKKRKAA